MGRPELVLAVARSAAQGTLNRLIAQGLLDARRKIATRGGEVLFPIRANVPEMASLGEVRRERLEPRAGGRPIDRIREASRLPWRLASSLPSRWQRMGDVIALRLPAGLKPHARRVGAAYAQVLKAKAVVDTGRIEGELRVPRARLIHGRSALTVHREHGVLYSLDATKVMFSKGNKAERQRLPALVRPGEVVVDMFAGIGYFSLPIAVRARPRVVVGVEKNPVSYRFLEKNARLNGVEKVVKPIRGDCRRMDLRKAAGVRRADRIILGYIPENPEFVGGYGVAWEFLPKAIELSKPGAPVHLHALARRGAGKMPEIPGFRVVGTRRVKSYGPETYHIVLDLIRRQSRGG